MSLKIIETRDVCLVRDAPVGDKDFAIDNSC